MCELRELHFHLNRAWLPEPAHCVRGVCAGGRSQAGFCPVPCPAPQAPRAAAAHLGEPAADVQGPVQQAALWGLTQTAPASNEILAWEWLLSKAQRVLLASGGQGKAVGT